MTDIIKFKQEHTEQPQENIKSIIKDLQDMTFKAHELSAGDLEVFGSLVSEELDRLFELLGMTELSITAEVKEALPATTIKEQLQDIYSLNDSMITGNPYHIPTYDDGTVIKQSDLADMNMNALDLIAEMLGFELEEGATPWMRQESNNVDEVSPDNEAQLTNLLCFKNVKEYILSTNPSQQMQVELEHAFSIIEMSLGMVGTIKE
ncbi:hypothetical protein [Lactococcus sp. DD01]|uniref:hypothetical protein n=1 Tax=Lactococcus sp. DD01 TaxID=1776443 RepID=UPI0007762B60|nr:hypothetical protein [Lactococcus sp. DD01]KXT61903.1 prophage ps1 protein 04 [Lactococcus sp. DD01]